jgi:L-fuconolactonase
VIIDAHQHVWNLDRASYPWLGPEHGPINRTIEFDELRPHLRAAGVDATVLVQSADNDADTDYMLDVAARNREVAAVVVSVPLEHPRRAAARLDEVRRNPHVVGVRNLIHDLPDPEWLLRPDVDEGLSVLERADVTFDLVSVLPRHLELVPTLGERHPNLRIVIDHLSKPPIGLGPDGREPWWSLIERAAENPLVHAKVSGLYSAVPGRMADWTPDDIRPFFDRALELFGPERLMYGGDWPISVLAGDYERVWEGLREVTSNLGDTDRDRIFGGTAAEFYRIDAALLERAAAASAD